MKKYLELKIRKKYGILIGIIIVFVCGLGGYYTWCSYHPIIDIHIVEGGRGENLKIETPSVIVKDRFTPTAASV